MNWDIQIHSAIIRPRLNIVERKKRWVYKTKEKPKEVLFCLTSLRKSTNQHEMIDCIWSFSTRNMYFIIEQVEEEGTKEGGKEGGVFFLSLKHTIAHSLQFEWKLRKERKQMSVKKLKKGVFGPQNQTFNMLAPQWRGEMKRTNLVQYDWRFTISSSVQGKNWFIPSQINNNLKQFQDLKRG